MSENSFAIAFSGELVEGADPAQVRKNLAQLFKTSPDQVEKLFSGKRVALKKDLDQQTALKYQAVLKKAGAVTVVVNTAVPAAAKAEQSTTQPQPAAAPKAPAAAAKGESIESVTRAVVKAAPTDMSAFEGVVVDQPGVVLIEHTDIPMPDIDTSELSMAEVGVELVKHEAPVPLQVDTSELSMAEAGVDLVKHEEAAPLQVDTSAMSMAEPGVTLVEPKPVEPPKIDTSRLSLSD